MSIGRHQAEPRSSGLGGLIAIGGLVLFGILALTVLFGSWYTVDEGLRGVILRNGRLVGTAEPGLHFKLPLVDDVEKFSTRTKVVRWEKVAAYSRDQQPADMALSVNYHIPAAQVEEFYTTYGSDEETIISNLIAPRAFQQLKNIFGQFTAQEAIQKRADLNRQVEAALAEAVKGRPVGIDGIQVENIDFSDAYESAVEARMTAEVEVAKQRQTLEREKVQAQIAVTQAQGRADSVKAEADAKAYSVRAQGEAEAAAIQARGKSLKDNPDLIRLVQAERWNGELPRTMLPGGAVPMINMGTTDDARRP